MALDKILFLLSPGRKARATEHYSNDLGAEDDDIITDAQSPIPQHSLFSAPHGHSQPAGKVFVERSSECGSGFTALVAQLPGRKEAASPVEMSLIYSICLF